MTTNCKITLKSFNNKGLDEACKTCVEQAKKVGLDVSFVRLPKKKKKITVIKSPHVHKKSREQFEIVSYNRLISMKGKRDVINEVIESNITQNKHSFFLKKEWYV